MAATLEHVQIRLTDAEKTQFTGASLVHSLYTKPVNILLSGELGAGKTTFFQGMAKEFGIKEHVTSPTYALEQRYQAKDTELIHIDLYRLESSQTLELVEHSNDHAGVRVIEWADRIEEPLSDNTIRIDLCESADNTRVLTARFCDVQLPTAQQIQNWRQDVQLPGNICDHCDAVADTAKRFGEALLKKGVIARPNTVYLAGLVHDLFRFVDFKPGGAPPGVVESDKEKQHWETWREKYAKIGHEAGCASFLCEQGYVDLAYIVEPHGVCLPKPSTTEQKLLFYADKRTMIDKLVTLDERYKDFADRYNSGTMSAQGKQWLEQAKAIERDLFPDGPPF